MFFGDGGRGEIFYVGGVCVFFVRAGCTFFCMVVFFVRASIEDLSTIDRKSMKSVKSVKKH